MEGEIMKGKVQLLLEQTKERTFRDPCAYYADGVWHLYYSLVQNEEDGQYFYLAESTSTDLKKWSEPRILSERGKHLNYSSPGNVFVADGMYHICLQTYPRTKGELYGDENSRVFLMSSTDLVEWSEPRLLRVKGDVPESEMGRIIDPYIVWDGDSWLCFYKQNGVSFSRSKDLVNWEFLGYTACGENVCVLKDEEYYYVFHSPKNGIGLLRSKDLKEFEDCGITTLGQENFLWGKDRITAGFVIEHEGKNYLFFHGDNMDDYDWGASVAMIEDWDFKAEFGLK